VRHLAVRIVIVEDNKIVLQVLKAAFDVVGAYELSDFETAAAGLAACRNGADLAIFDHRLPDMKGIEAIRLLRSEEATRHMPIIMITADDDPGTRMDAIQAGATDFLKKPLNIEELRLRVRNLLALQQAQKNADERERLLKTVIAASGTSLAVMDVAADSDRYVYASDGFLAATGLHADEILGAGAGLVWRAFKRCDAREQFEAAIRDRAAGRYVFERLTTDGPRAWAEVSLRPVPQPGDAANYLVVTLEDISDLVTAREANQHLFDRMSDIARVSGAWFFEIDSDNRVTYISDTMARGLELRPEDILGRSIDSLPLKFNDPQKQGRALSSLFVDPSAAIENEELTVQTAAGIRRCIQISAVPFRNTDGRVGGFRGSASDVSVIAAARDAAARASRAKSAFLATMSHEMQTPLTAIIGMMDILIATNTTEETIHDLRLVLESAQGLSDVLRNVLDLAALDNETIVFRMEDIDACRLLDALTTKFRAQAGAKGVGFETVVNGADLRLRRGDYKRVEQVFQALTSNAVKFTETGMIRVCLDTERHDAISLAVSDTGIGMSDAEIVRALEPFAQVDDSMARRFDGSGMGLSIARGLVSAMAGSIDIQSVPGQGTTVRAVLPLPSVSVQAVAPLGCDLAGQRVLVADDNAANRKILQIMLQKLGAEVTMCEDGDIALKVWRPGRFDLVLLDINMPRLAGTDVIRKIRLVESRDDHARVPAIAVTANAAADQVSGYLTAGFDHYVGKPFTTKSLSNVVQHVLGREDHSAIIPH
jgi:PAS domain S-box-containing protein